MVEHLTEKETIKMIRQAKRTGVSTDIEFNKLLNETTLTAHELAKNINKIYYKKR